MQSNLTTSENVFEGFLKVNGLGQCVISLSINILSSVGCQSKYVNNCRSFLSNTRTTREMFLSDK